MATDWKAIGEKLIQIGLPTIGGALGGPGGLAIGKLIASAIGLATDSSPEDIAAAVGNLSGDQIVKLKELEYNYAKAQLDATTQLAQGQISVDLEEAKSHYWFEAGWRPFIGWTCGLAFAYQYVGKPISTFFVYLFGTTDTLSRMAMLPNLDLSTMMPVLIGMLGLGLYRTYEKSNGAQQNH